MPGVPRRDRRIANAMATVGAVTSSSLWACATLVGANFDDPRPGIAGAVEGGADSGRVNDTGCLQACGEDGSRDCCDSESVPGGTFLRDYDGVDYRDSSHP